MTDLRSKIEHLREQVAKRRRQHRSVSFLQRKLEFLVKQQLKRELRAEKKQQRDDAQGKLELEVA